MGAEKSSSNRLALVTGASSGLGAAFALRLAKEAYDLIIVARRRDRLEALAKELQTEHRIHVEVLQADLGTPSGLRKVEERVIKAEGLDLLVNNAGFGGYMAFIELDPDKAEELIRVKVLAVTRLTRAALPGMLSRGIGAIINVSSRLALRAPLGSSQLPKRATYAGANAYINTFTQLLQSEMEDTGVRLQALCPGVVQTEFHERVGLKPSSYPAAIVMQPEEVVSASLKGLELGEVICVPSMEDPSLFAKIEADQRTFFEGTRTGKLAARYQPG